MFVVIARDAFLEVYNISILKYWVSAVFAITIIIGFIYAGIQKVYRQNANDPQIQIAEDTVSFLNTGQSPAAVVPQNNTEISKSLAPFLMVFDKSGKVISSSAVLDGKIPDYPREVLGYVAEHREEKVTWEPQKNVRIASVAIKYNNGFVVAGRSLREAEKRINMLTMMAAFSWLGLVVVITFPFIFNFQRKKRK